VPLITRKNSIREKSTAENKQERMVEKGLR